MLEICQNEDLKSAVVVGLLHNSLKSLSPLKMTEFLADCPDWLDRIPDVTRHEHHRTNFERFKKRIVACQVEVSQAQEALAKAQSELQQEEQGLTDGEARLAIFMQESAKAGP